MNPDLLAAAEEMKALLVARATGKITGQDAPADAKYRSARATLLQVPSTKSKLPDWVVECGDLFEFWGFIGDKFATYKERRAFLQQELLPLLRMLEDGATSPGDDAHPELLKRLDWNEVQLAWRKALERKTADPEGAITSARTLLEAVCKHILDDAGETYDPTADLPKLYGLATRVVRLAPSQHTEKIFKQILGGCHSVVEGLGALRSKVGDAHGQGKRPIKPAPRHAELAVNLAGSMALFLAQTWEKTKEDRGR